MHEFGPGRVAFCTDDREPGHIAREGHVNSMVRRAVEAGVDARDALAMASCNAAAWHGLGDRGAIAPAASGIVIPDTAKEKPQEGKVLAVGPGRIDDNGNRIPLDVQVGDVVIYSKYGGTEVKYNGEEYLILSARDVLAVVN